MTNNSLSINVGDFDEVKDSLKAFLQAQGRFTDYNFEGSNMSAMLDVMAYNTYLNLMHKNMSINELFRQTALLRHNVAARAEEVNYIYRSFRSSSAKLQIVLTSPTQRSSIVIPKGTMFTTRVDSRSFTFTTNQSYIASFDTTANGKYYYTALVDVYEGTFLSESYPYTDNAVMLLTNSQIDTTSLSVTVIENSGSTISSYKLATTALDLNDQSEVYFLRVAPDGRYQVAFGDGVSGKKPKINSIVALDYRVSSGQLPNGAGVFKAGQSIDGISDIAVTTITPASGGDVWESTDSIRFNASRTLTAQERATGEEDYLSIIQRENNDIIDVIATGGEKLSPPRYGQVQLSLVSTKYDRIPADRKQSLIDFLKLRSMMTPFIVDTDNVYISVESNVTFDKRKTTQTSSDIQSLVTAAVESYGTDNLGKFGGSLVFSKLFGAIDNAHPAIEGNDTVVKLIKKVDPVDMAKTQTSFTFGSPVTSLSSSTFTYNGQSCYIADISDELFIYSRVNNTKIQNIAVGQIDYDTGAVKLNQLSTGSRSTINFYATPANKTITPASNMILRIDTNDVTVLTN